MILSRLLPVVHTLSLAAAAFAADENNALSDAEKAAGWKLLFDGKTTDGWVGHRQGHLSG
ncbi:MAG: hypothetical protein WDN28_01965 [Chthoniobacter sp.]